jgi:hypothetical protein
MEIVFWKASQPPVDFATVGNADDQDDNLGMVNRAQS